MRLSPSCALLALLAILISEPGHFRYNLEVNPGHTAGALVR